MTHDDILKRIEQLMDAEPGTPEFNELERLSRLADFEESSGDIFKDLNVSPFLRKSEARLRDRWHIEAISFFHAIVIIALVFATIEDVYTYNWGDVVFDVTLLGNQLLPARACILTYIENIWRKKAGIRPIKGWISHYLMREHEDDGHLGLILQRQSSYYYNKLTDEYFYKP